MKTYNRLALGVLTVLSFVLVISPYITLIPLPPDMSFVADVALSVAFGSFIANIFME